MRTQSNFAAHLSLAVLTATFALAAPMAFGHGDAHPTKAKTNITISPDEQVFGKQGDPKHVTRTITVDMGDNMRFSPSAIQVKQGETIKFVVKNKGQLNHEMVLGSMDELKVHGELMKKNPGMEHDEPYMAHVSPSNKEDMVWQFTKAGEFNFGCLILGHFEAGMLGKITVIKG